MEKEIYIDSNLKLLRKAHDITLRELSKQTGVSNAYLSQIENGLKDNVTMKIAMKIADYFNVDFYEMCFRKIETVKIEYTIIWTDNA